MPPPLSLITGPRPLIPFACLAPECAPSPAVSATPVLAHLLHVRLCPKAMYPLSLGAVRPQVDRSALSPASWDHPSPFLPSEVAPTEPLKLPNTAGAWWVSHQRSHRSGFPSDLRSTRQVLLTLSEPHSHPANGEAPYAIRLFSQDWGTLLLDLTECQVKYLA